MPKDFDRRSFLLCSLALVLSACTQRRNHPTASPYNRSVKPVAARSSGFKYTVKQGDTLSSISRRSGISVQSIVRVNKLKSNVIYPGNTLVLPGISSMRSDPLARTESNDYTYRSGKHYNYRIVRRRQWTNQPVRKNHRLMGSVNRITIHHTGEHGDIAKLPDLEVVKRIENYHRNERKWAAIGYHYLVGRDGKIYEGRPAKYQGAHTRSNNRNNLGISMIGDFNKRKPSGVQLAALESLLNDMRAKYGINRRKVFGHRDLSPSVCPGKHLYAWLQSYKG